MRRLGIVIAALAVTLSACGGGSSGSSSSSSSGTTSAPSAQGVSAARLIAASADKAAAAKTARMSGEITVDVGGKQRTLPLDGALDFTDGAFEFTYDMSALGLPGAGDAKIQARMVDGVMYMSFGDLAGSAGGAMAKMLGGKTWVKLDLGALGLDSAASSGGLSEANPSGTLDSLRGAGSVERVGTETLRGVETTHYRATIDPQKALEQTPADLRDRVKSALDQLGGPIPVDVWIDGDGQARKVSTEVDAQSAKVSTSIEYYDFGAAVDVSAPPADDVFDFSQMFGGLRRLAGVGSDTA